MTTLDPKTQDKLSALVASQKQGFPTISEHDINMAVKKAESVKMVELTDFISIEGLCSSVGSTLPESDDFTLFCFLRFNGMKVNEYHKLSQSLNALGGNMKLSLQNDPSGKASPYVCMFYFINKHK